jgi:hypothetical protein
VLVLAPPFGPDAAPVSDWLWWWVVQQVLWALCFSWGWLLLLLLLLMRLVRYHQFVLSVVQPVVWQWFAAPLQFFVAVDVLTVVRPPDEPAVDGEVSRCCPIA